MNKMRKLAALLDESRFGRWVLPVGEEPVADLCIERMACHHKYCADGIIEGAFPVSGKIFCRVFGCSFRRDRSKEIEEQFFNMINGVRHKALPP